MTTTTANNAQNEMESLTKESPVDFSTFNFKI